VKVKVLLGNLPGIMVNLQKLRQVQNLTVIFSFNQFLRPLSCVLAFCVT